MKKYQGISRILMAFCYSWDGLKAAFVKEAAFRQEFLLFLMALPIIGLLPLTSSTRVLLVLMHLATLVVELLNSAIEAVVDLASPEKHPLAKQAKDMGSAAVMVTLIGLLCSWACALAGLMG